MWKIFSRVLLSVGLLLYVAVALVNYSLVQSYVGAAVGSYFSKEWGGEVRIGSLHAMPFDHVIMDDVLLVSPTGDTIFTGETLRVGFRRFPFRDHGLELDHVYLRNAYYHLETGGKEKINLQFIIDYFKPKEEKGKKEGPKRPFTVTARSLELVNVHYKMDLPDKRERVYAYGVEIPHMEFLGIHGKFKNIKVVNDDVRCRIVHLRTRERSGFAVEEISGQVHVSRYEIVARDFHVATGRSDIRFDGELHYDTWKGMKGYVSTVDHRATIKPGTYVSMSDVAYWAPVLWGIEARAEVEGEARGTIDSLVADLDVRWGRGSEVLVSGSVVGLPRIDTTDFDLWLERLRTDSEDLQPIIALGRLPDHLLHTFQSLGTVEVTGRFDGGWRERAAANLNVATALGGLAADVSLRRTATGHAFTVDAESGGMDLSLLRSDWLSRSGFALTAQGALRAPRRREEPLLGRLDAEGELKVAGGVVRGRPLSQATLSCSLQKGLGTARLQSDDSLASLDLVAVADLRDSVHTYVARLDLAHLDLGILPHPLAAHVEVRGRGNSLEDLSGTVEATKISYGDLRLERAVALLQTDGEGKTAQLRSDMVDATLSGLFRYEDLPLMARHFASSYLPELFNTVAPVGADTLDALGESSVAFHVQWKDDGRHLRALTDGISVARGSRLDGSYSLGEQLKVVMRSDSVRFGSVVLDNMGLVGRLLGDSYMIELESGSVGIGQVPLFDDFAATVGSKRELATLDLKWGTEGKATHGDLAVGLEGNDLRIFRPWFHVGSTQWELSADRLRLSTGERLSIDGEGISLSSEEQHIAGRMKVHGEPNDCIELFFDRFNLDLLGEVLLQDTPVEAEGDISGRFTLYGLGTTPYFNANLRIDSCVVNRQPLGSVDVVTNWNAELNIVNLQLGSRQLHALGWVGLGGESPELNFSIGFNGFDLALAAPFLASFSSHFGGRLDGSLDVKGSVRHPEVMGEAYVTDGILGLDPTGVTYRFADSLRFHGTTVTMDRFRLRDPLGNSATVDGAMAYTSTNDLRLDLAVSTDNLLVLDKKSGESFYGTLLVSADGRVSGPVDNLDIDVRARTNPGCDLTIPVSYQQQVKSQNYISFVSDQPAYETESGGDGGGAGYSLELDLAITPDVKLNLPMDFSEVTVGVGARGSGDLHVGLGAGRAPQIMGAYEITSGTMKVGLLSVYEKGFTLESGSSLNFQGNVPDARFDLRAVYSQRVNMSTLTGNLSAIDNTQKYLQVENVIAISGTLQDPSIGFDIRLPGADQSVEEEVFAYIDRNSERDMLNQTLSLLLGGSFYNVSNNNMTGGNPLDIVTSFVGNSLTDMVQFVDVDVNFKSATEMTNEQFDLNISKDWGRWYLESTLGYGGDSRELEADAVGGAIVDALIGYRLSPLVHLFAYNRTNTNDYTRIDLPYKQGIGLKLTKDFERWADLFRHSSKRKGAKR